ncbi:hypothetical protein [Ornithinimicrobium kibberense]|uniref:hypothetical protein n=1 Tax=Ornithinimicrobium kibberense TaxID=282060 RepID=UPI00361FDAD0
MPPNAEQQRSGSHFSATNFTECTGCALFRGSPAQRGCHSGRCVRVGQQLRRGRRGVRLRAVGREARGGRERRRRPHLEEMALRRVPRLEA